MLLTYQLCMPWYHATNRVFNLLQKYLGELVPRLSGSRRPSFKLFNIVFSDWFFQAFIHPSVIHSSFIWARPLNDNFLTNFSSGWSCDRVSNETELQPPKFFVHLGPNPVGLRNFLLPNALSLIAFFSWNAVFIFHQKIILSAFYHFFLHNNSLFFNPKSEYWSSQTIENSHEILNEELNGSRICLSTLTGSSSPSSSLKFATIDIPNHSMPIQVSLWNLIRLNCVGWV